MISFEGLEDMSGALKAAGGLGFRGVNQGSM